MSVQSSTATFSFAMLSSLGRVRSGNEDFCAADAGRGAFIVCDGMGGAAAGEIASRLAATTFLRHLEAALPLTGATQPLLHAAAAAANSAVFQQAEREAELRGMGTTLVALLLERQLGDRASGPEDRAAKLWLTHVGDSRCYRMRAGELKQMTQDHSLVQEQIDAGHLTPEQAERSPMRNIVTRAIGSAAAIKAEVRVLDAEPGDLYLLASDGLTRELSDAELTKHLIRSDLGNEALCQALIDAANEAGGHDNVTVLVLRFGAG